MKDANDDEDLDKLLEKLEKPKRVNSKLKGNRYQNLLAKKFNKKFNTDEFSSTPGSGAYATNHTLPKHLQLHGDLVTPLNFKFCIEAKHGYGVDLYDLFKESSTLNKFIKQAKRDAKAAEKDWLLIYRKNNQKDLVILHYSNLVPANIPKVSFGVYVIVLLDDLLGLDPSYFTLP